MRKRIGALIGPLCNFLISFIDHFPYNKEHTLTSRKGNPNEKTVGKLLIIAGILILVGMMLNGREGFSFFGFDDESARTYHAQGKDIDKIDIDAKSITVNIQAENRDDIKAEISGKTSGLIRLNRGVHSGFPLIRRAFGRFLE